MVVVSHTVLCNVLLELMASTLQINGWEPVLWRTTAQQEEEEGASFLSEKDDILSPHLFLQGVGMRHDFPK